jgi:hypothetical protein|tara:strand:- start:31 stop:843 length:813 start_codon:yes stop_codon:yes gene_type:complete
MKVLHVWNTAGVGSLMAKSLRKNGIDCDLFMRKSHDKFGFSKYYGDNLVNMSGGSFVNMIYNISIDYDIIHVHSAFAITKELRRLNPTKKIILQYHGSELRNGELNELRIYNKCVDEIITSTKDLNEYLNQNNIENTLIENAVDTDLFYFRDDIKKDNALMFNMKSVDQETSLKIARSFVDWKILLINRQKNFIHYEDMPEALNRFRYYIDIKVGLLMNGQPSQAISKTGREALACGLEVLNYKGEIVQGLPIEYTPEYQVNKLIDLYIR